MRAFAILSAVALIGCGEKETDDSSSDDTGVGQVDCSDGVCVLTGTLTEDLTLTADTVWLLRGGVFVGESMFSAVSDASKIALVHLAQSAEYRLIDCQLPSEHLASLGAVLTTRQRFSALLDRWCTTPPDTPAGAP